MPDPLSEIGHSYSHSWRIVSQRKTSVIEYRVEYVQYRKTKGRNKYISPPAMNTKEKEKVERHWKFGSFHLPNFGPPPNHFLIVYTCHPVMPMYTIVSTRFPNTKWLYRC
jgi:hypothetical protein